MKYSRYIPEKQRRETWEETVERNKQMHMSRFPHAKEEIDQAYEHVLSRKIMPSMRSLQFGGESILNKHAKMFNCSGLGISTVNDFADMMYLLLCGCGVGFSVRNVFIDRIEEVKPADGTTSTFVVPDSIEGWADGVKELFHAYIKGHDITFDYSEIRPKGSLIKSSLCEAPGPDTYRKSIESVQKILENKRKTENYKFTSLEVFDICCYLADAVLSGGIRRCWKKGSLVHTKKGMIPIENVTKGMDVLTSDGYRKVTNNFEQGEQNLLKITTADSFFEVTPDHRMAVYDSLYTYKWVKAKNLKPSDRLLSPRVAIAGQKSKLPECPCDDSITVPELTEDVAWLVGNLLNSATDKSGKVSLVFHSDNTAAIERAALVFPSFTSAKVSIKKVKGTNSVIVGVKSRQLGAYFNSWLKQPNATIRIPECIFLAPKNIRLAFLEGVLDVDDLSHQKGNQHSVATTCPEFTKDIVTLMSSLGLSASMCDGAVTHERERLSDTFPAKFLKGYEGDPRIKAFSTDIDINWSFITDLDDEISKNYAPVKVISIEKSTPDMTYDIEVEDKHEFFCEGYLSHNSACICLFDKDDTEMLNAKSGNWWENNSQRTNCNISVQFDRETTTYDEFEKVYEISKASGSGEPGFAWTNNEEWVGNPCLPADSLILTSDGIKEINDLIGVPFKAIVEGKEYDSHAGFFYTGDKEVYKLTLNNGLEVKATDNHKILKGDDTWCELGKLQIGDEIKINYGNTPTEEINQDEFDKGWLVGECWGDGCHNPSKYSSLVRFWGEDNKHLAEKACDIVNRLLSNPTTDDREYNDITPVHAQNDNYKDPNIFTVSSKRIGGFVSSYLEDGTKNIKAALLNESFSFIMGFVSGCFDSDGSISGSTKASESMLQLAQSKKEDLALIQQMLLKFGINSSVRTLTCTPTVTLPDGKGGFKEYAHKQPHRLDITKSNIQKFATYIGFNDTKKQNTLDAMIDNMSKDFYREKYIQTVKSIEFDSYQPVYDCTVEEVHRFGANSVMVHNCFEISFESHNFCNLTEINLGTVKDQEDLNQRAFSAAILGTLQASYTDFGYISSKWKENAEKSALLGVGITGIASRDLSTLDFKEASRKVREANTHMANLLGINTADRTNTIKPSGTCSLFLGTSSGIHAWHAPYYIRRVRVNKQEPLYQYLVDNVPDLIEDDVYKPTDGVFKTIVKAPDDAVCRKDETATEFLERVMYMQREWIYPGHYEGDNHNNVSCTVNVRNTEWDDVKNWLWENRMGYTGVSLLPYSDTTYQQAPLEECTEEDYLEFIKKDYKIDLASIREEKNFVNFGAEAACSAGGCELV